MEHWLLGHGIVRHYGAVVADDMGSCAGGLLCRNLTDVGLRTSKPH